MASPGFEPLPAFLTYKVQPELVFEQDIVVEAFGEAVVIEAELKAPKAVEETLVEQETVAAAAGVEEPMLTPIS